jgi:hypothetical protein
MSLTLKGSLAVPFGYPAEWCEIVCEEQQE